MNRSPADDSLWSDCFSQEEEAWLQIYANAVGRLKEHLEGRDEDYMKIIWALKEDPNARSTLRQEYPPFFDSDDFFFKVARDVLEALNPVEKISAEVDEEENTQPILTVRPRTS